MEYIAHKTQDGRTQSVEEHLKGVSKKCSEYAIAEFKDYAALCGLLHDVGKYQSSFQKRINGAPISVGHAMCGAQELSKQQQMLYSPLLEYCIAGHHAGLPNGGIKNDTSDKPTLNGILKRDCEDYSQMYNEIRIKYPKDDLGAMFDGINNLEDMIELYAFFTRYMYSCLTDADFIDTENFCSPDIERTLGGDFKEAYRRICEKLDSFRAETKLQKSRGKIQEQVYDSIDKGNSLYAVDMPTGSGKTLCSMRAALKAAIEQNKKRIIYVIPFVSVIEQTARVFGDIFGDALPILEHHSNYDFDEKTDFENETTSEKLKRSCENWDAKLVITTNLQFFESIYHYRSSRLRKMHNIADSVIVFDEVHILPPRYIKPCLRAIGYITKYLHSIAFIMSATMPNYAGFIGEHLNGVKITDAVGDKRDFAALKKCSYSYIGLCTYYDIAERISSCGSTLVIVNSKKRARELYQMCRDSFDGETVHLSTNITPRDRADAIDKIRRYLDEGIRTLVISTSLIEAGVDLDFETVYRENAGLDNILQAGGRCNREGKREIGNVYVFEIDGGYGDVQIKSGITRSLFDEYDDVSDDECIKEYYSRLFADAKEIIEKNTIVSYMGEYIGFDAIPFRSYAENFSFIDNDTAGVVIPCEENYELINTLKFGASAPKRKLQKYCASVKYYELEEMKKLGIIDEISGIWVLSNPDYYTKEIGLNIDTQINYLL